MVCVIGHRQFINGLKRIVLKTRRPVTTCTGNVSMITRCIKNLISIPFVLVCIALPAQNVVDLKIAELPHIQKTIGNPKTVTTSLGQAVDFSGSDGYFLNINPLKGMSQFTLEAIFKPDSDGGFEQRFLHLGMLSGERVMFEIRVNRDSTWYFDTYISLSNGDNLTMINEKLTHPTGKWYHVALVVDGTRAVVYINGVVEFNEPIAFIPINEGIASIGVRQNLVSWFKGSIYRVRVTPRILEKIEFLNDHLPLRLCNFAGN